MNKKQNSIKISVKEELGVRETSPTMKIYDGFLYESIQFFMKENYSISIVFSWTAVEIKTQQTIGQLFREKLNPVGKINLAQLEKAIFPNDASFNPTNDKIKRILNALTGKEIQNEKFWNGLIKIKKWRHDIVHNNNHKYTRKQAEEARDTVNQLSKYLENF